MNMRTDATEAALQQALSEGKGIVDFLDSPALREYQTWKIIENKYPYDIVAKKHHLLVPIRKVDNELFMTPEERDELVLIKRTLGREYDSFLENSKHQRTIHGHYHVHLIQWK